MSKADTITTFLCGLSRNSGSLPEPSRPVQACTGIAIILYSSSHHTHTQNTHTKHKTHNTQHTTHNMHMTEIQRKPNNQLYPMSQLCVTKGNRNIRIGGMLDTVTLVCTLGQGVRADVARFPLLAIYILFISIKHNSKWTTLVALGFADFLAKMRGLMSHFVFPVATFVLITTW